MFLNSLYNYEICTKAIPLIKNKIVITGGPSTGKTAIINYLEERGETCIHEISRTLILEAQKEGIDQLFLENPTLFSQKLLVERINQFKNAQEITSSLVFIDRGIPDIIAYMNYINESNPIEFIESCKKYKYDYIFLLPPWESIHITDNERYESFEQAQLIYHHLLKTYSDLGYDCIEVPFGTIEERSNFIFETLQ